VKVVILAGGYGSRLAEETALRPKPMVEIGGIPILIHIMRTFAARGHKDFVICCGYKGEVIKRYFANFYLENSDIRVDLGSGNISYLNSQVEDWSVTLVNTGIETMTGGRIRRIKPYVDDAPFLLTYGDGVADIDINEVVKFHQSHGRHATVTAVPSPGRFGILELNNEAGVDRFHEKPENETGWINGGYFVLEAPIFEYLDSDETIWEREPLERLANDGQLQAFRHRGFWKAMDSLRDKRELEQLWDTGSAPWQR
jgi:glucose-1-phosphate cytidylyltransferase